METLKAREIISVKSGREHCVPQGVVKNRICMTGVKPYYGKRLADIIVASLLTLAFLSWLTPLIALLIWLDSKGPVLFRQRRVGKDGRIFTCLKFRTMHPNSFSDLVQASDNDERITHIGVLLRKSHLDELPQLLNILRGDMSFVGPRPHMLSDEASFATQVPLYSVRLAIRPGLTGLAQVKGYHGPTPDFQSIYFRVKLDYFYVQNLSPLFDLKIITSTLLLPFSKPGLWKS